jgi:hypothetical protein
MSKSILVVIGAGASHDLIPKIGAVKLASSNDDYRPPLTANLFEPTAVTKEIFDDFPDARALAAPIRRHLASKQLLEPYLKTLADATEGDTASNYLQIPLYLQKLFAKISAEYTNQPHNYNLLVHGLLDHQVGFDRVAFLTLNYDTFLDEALALGSNQAISMDAYVTPRRMLIKLHGSWNWAVPIAPIEGLVSWPVKMPAYLDALRKIGNSHLSRQLLYRDVTIAPKKGEWWEHMPQRGREGIIGEPLPPLQLYYPAISAPIGKYDQPLCPVEHLIQLRRFMKTCTNVLAIGVSAQGDDLFAELRELSERVMNFAVVNGSQKEADDALKRFKSNVPQVANAVLQQAFASSKPKMGSFSSFMHDGEFERVISNCS